MNPRDFDLDGQGKFKRCPALTRELVSDIEMKDHIWMAGGVRYNSKYDDDSIHVQRSQIGR